MSVLIANKQKIGSALQLGVSLLLIAFLFSIIDLQSFLTLMVEFKPAYFLVGLALYFFALSIHAVRWQYILKGAGETVRLLQLISINLIGSFFSIFLPTAVGGDLARMYESSRTGITATKSVSTVLLDRVIGLISLVIISLLALVAGYRYAGERYISYSVIGIALGLAFSWWLFFNHGLMLRFTGVFRLPLINRWESRIRQLYHSLYKFRNRPKLLLSAILISFVAQGVEIFSAVFVARSLGVESKTIYFFIFIPLIWLVTMLPISFNGIGLRESTFIVLFGQVGVTSAEAIAISLLVYSLRLIAGLVGGGLFLQSSLINTINKWFNRKQRPV